MDIFIWDIFVLDDALNVYQAINGYLSLRRIMQMDLKRFFFGPGLRQRRKRILRRSICYAKDNFNPSIKNMCKGAGIDRFGFQKVIISQTFRATMIQWLLDAKHLETVIVKRSGLKDVRNPPNVVTQPLKIKLK